MTGTLRWPQRNFQAKVVREPLATAVVLRPTHNSKGREIGRVRQVIYRSPLQRTQRSGRSDRHIPKSPLERIGCVLRSTVLRHSLIPITRHNNARTLSALDHSV